MCGRYQLALPGKTLAQVLEAQLGAISFEPTWNAAPSQLLPVLMHASNGARVLEAAHWGLIPAWARRPDREWRPLINARAETVLEKPSFRSAVRKGRVLVPTTGFYEWAGPKGHKVPHSIRVRGEAIDPASGKRLGRDARPGEAGFPFLMAGIAEVWTTADHVPELTFSILTTTPNDVCAPIHDRMPVILEGEDADAWLSAPPEATELLMQLAQPFASNRMEEWPVSTMVNDVRQHDVRLAQPAVDDRLL